MAATASKPFISGGYLALALKLQESGGDLTSAGVREKLIAALTDPAITPLGEAGARHSSSDMQLLQTIHDHAGQLGAKCDGAEEMAESAGAAAEGRLTLTESATTLDPIILREARADYEIKLIAPGKGSSAFYPAEVLQRDGPQVFKAGTHVYLNHPTSAEESARPEGDIRNLAGVLTTAAAYHETHAKGPGLYARMKVFADHGQLVEEKAPHVGMSIRASGVAEAGKGRDGVPVLKELTGAESVDVVTRAGAGGMILTEAAKPQSQHEEVAVEATELTKLQEALKTQESSLAVQMVLNKRLLERAIKADAREEGMRLLESVSLPEASKSRIVSDVLSREIPTAEGALDLATFKPLVEAAAQAEGRYVAALIGSGQVRGMGPAPAPHVDVAEAARIQAREKDETEAGIKVYESMGMSRAAAEKAFGGRAS